MPERPCPICRRPVASDAESLPFCSRRCRLIDLGAWAAGDYRLPAEPASAEELEAELARRRRQAAPPDEEDGEGSLLH